MRRSPAQQPHADRRCDTRDEYSVALFEQFAHAGFETAISIGSGRHVQPPPEFLPRDRGRAEIERFNVDQVDVNGRKAKLVDNVHELRGENARFGRQPGSRSRSV